MGTSQDEIYKKRIYIKELETIVEGIDREKGIDKQENGNNGHKLPILGSQRTPSSVTVTITKAKTNNWKSSYIHYDQSTQNKQPRGNL